MLHSEKKLDYLCNCKLELSNVCNLVEGHCLQAMKIMHHHAYGRQSAEITTNKPKTTHLSAFDSIVTMVKKRTE